MGRIALVTGGTRGIGAAISRLLSNKGFTVVANYAANEPAAALFATDTGIATYRWSVADFAATSAACARIEAEHGPIDVLINNAGITRDASLAKLTWEAWDEVLHTNLGGCFNLAKACFPGMKARGWGRIVNIGSINGQGGQFGQVNYSAAKSGIHGFTKALALEGAKFGVTVNTLAPGYVETDMVAAVAPEVLAQVIAKIPVGRLGQADEIARGVAFLCAENAGFVTGSTLSINGGQHMY
ncbi:MAG: acetoacetyl-CoA reductase [Novosphingobium sp.]